MPISATKVSSIQRDEAGQASRSPRQERRVSELTALQRAELGITCSLDDLRSALDDAAYLAACEDITYWNEEGREVAPDDLILVPALPAAEERDRVEPGASSVSTFGRSQW